MTCFSSASAKRAREIDRLLRKDYNDFKKELKLLLLGTGESGKSTIIKQMSLIHGKGFSEQDRIQLKPLIFQNIVRNLKAILDAMESFQVPLEDAKLRDAAYKIQDTNVYDVQEIQPFAHDLGLLWADAGVQKAFARRNEFQISDSTTYFFSELRTIAQPNYLPTDDHILRARDPTTGIHEFVFILSNAVFRMLDVGGQRSERRKWIHCFADVTSILFIVAASEYDQTLVEEEGVNRMYESISLFEQIINYGHFKEASFIVFFNKQDILAEKIKISHLRTYFSDYRGADGDYEQAKEFIVGLFVSKVPETLTVYTHFTTAVDRRNMEVVFEAVRDTILRLSLKHYNLY
jgi:GTPase SAR1 family protein